MARRGNIEPVPRGSLQFICTECGDPFLTNTSGAKTCGATCRQRRKRRFDKNADAPEFAVDRNTTLAAMQDAKSQALDDLPAVAREVLADELRPAVREALSGRVLQSIGDMVELLPLVQDALRDDLTAQTPLLDSNGDAIRDSDGSVVYLPDYDRRAKAVALVAKYTVGQPGLAPQPEMPEQAPLVINFPTMPAPADHIEGAAVEELPELSEGERICDICREAKDAAEFVGDSPRCQACHDGQRARIEAAIAERTKSTG